MSEEDASPSDGETTEEQNSNGRTLLYGFPRKAMRTEDLKNIRDALEEEGYSFRYAEDSGNLLIERDEDAGDDADFSVLS
jgi:hypothetical protein